MNFANIQILYFLFLIPILIMGFVYYEKQRSKILLQFIVKNNPSAVMGAIFERRLIRSILLWLGLICLVLAAARPQWGSKLDAFSSRGIDIMLGS